MSADVRVDGLPAEVSEARLRRFFSQLANLVAVELLAPSGGEGTRSAILTFSTAEQAALTALVFDGRRLGPHPLRVAQLARPTAELGGSVGVEAAARRPRPA